MEQLSRVNRLVDTTEEVWEKEIRGGVDPKKMFATLDLIKAQPELARFRFRASNHWITMVPEMDDDQSAGRQ